MTARIYANMFPFTTDAAIGRYGADLQFHNWLHKRTVSSRYDSPTTKHCYRYLADGSTMRDSAVPAQGFCDRAIRSSIHRSLTLFPGRLVKERTDYIVIHAEFAACGLAVAEGFPQSSRQVARRPNSSSMRRILHVRRRPRPASPKRGASARPDLMPRNLDRRRSASVPLPRSNGSRTRPRSDHPGQPDR